VLQEQSVQLLQEFFKSQRRANRQEAASLKSFLREDAIRKTPHDLGGVRSAHAESHFYALKSVAGMRLHYRQSMAKEASQPKPQTYLCLHGANTSSSFFEPLLSSLLTPTLMSVSSGALRILVPDLLGHGASDRFKKSQSYSFSLAMNALLEWVQAMDLQAFTVITHDTALVWGLMLKALMPERVVSLVGLNPCWRSEIHAPLALASKGESSLRSSSLMGQLSQAEPSAVVLYRFMDHWLQKGSRVGDLKSHLLRLAPHLSDTELSELSCGFQQAFERTVFEAFHRLYPSLEAAFADFDLEVRDLHRHFDQDFLQKSRLMHTQPFSISVQPLPVDLVGSIVSSFAVHEALKGTEFLSQASMSRLGQVLREERL
jgi:pimeloyl-ACP methyl ester carboxylesterase